MASQDDHAEHLDAAAGREVVYCHACSHEWYRDDYGLMCPCCTSEVTEIVGVSKPNNYVCIDKPVLC
jgi:Zn finger protein HypA/HybF involved in hydrogenase expression